MKFPNDPCVSNEEGKGRVSMNQSVRDVIYKTGRIAAYRKSSNRSRPCIILDSKFPRLVLEVLQKL